VELITSACAGGGFRIARKPIKIAGFDINEGVVVTADPRIGNKDQRLFPSPDLYKPERWMPSGSSSSTSGSPSSSGKCPFTGTAAQLPKAAWFPGGTGVHQCPGVPLAELCAKVLLSKWLFKFESWDEISGPPDLILVPIKIPKDTYEVALKCRDREAAVAAVR
jgi:cytochrome P450